MSVSPTKRTLDHLAAEGWTADRVDCSNGRVSRDFLGAIDVMAFRGNEVMAIQVTGGGNGPARVRKLERDEYAGGLAALRKAGVRIVVWDWRKSKRRGWWIWEADLS